MPAAAAPPPPLKPRHYRKPDGLVRRTQGDLTPDELRARVRRGPFTETLLGARPGHPRLVGTAEGAFRRLLLTIPAYAVSSTTMSPEYSCNVSSQRCMAIKVVVAVSLRATRTTS